MSGRQSRDKGNRAERPVNNRCAVTRDDIVNDLHDALVWVDGTDDQTARDVVETVLDLVIARLRVDAEIPKRTVLQWELFFAGAAERAVEDLQWLSGMVEQNEAVCAIADHLEASDLEND